MDDIDWAAERVDAFNNVAVKVVLSRLEGPASTGICKSCGDTIDTQRLHANPRAHMCGDCASEQEEEMAKARRRGPR